MRIYPNKIRQQILWVNLLPMTLLIVLLSSYLISSRIESVDQGFRDRGQAIALQLATTSIHSLLENDYTSLGLLSKTAMQLHPDVEEVMVEDQHGFIVLQKEKNASSNRDQCRVFRAPVQTIDNIQGQQPQILDKAMNTRNPGILNLGKATVWINDQASQAAKREIILYTLLLAFSGLIFSAILAVVVSTRIARPVEQLTRATQRLRKGEIDVSVEQNDSGEIGELQRGFNHMAVDIASASENMQSRVEHATHELQENMETLEIQNVELDLARKRALDASRFKSKFLANMSHEIRTPMNGVLGFTHLLAKTRLDSLQQEYLGTIETSASSLLVIINDILDVSKLEADKLVLEDAAFSLRNCIDNTVAMLAPLAHQKHIELVAQVYNDVPDQLHGDQTRIAQIITNLVNNAIKFTDQGEVILKIMLEEENLSSIKLGISVTDTGVGIASDQQSSIFSAFTQAGTVTKTLGGTGLGLSICKHLVSAMQGSITLSSKPGEGSRFKVTISLEKVDFADALTTHTHSMLSGKKALLVEPHHAARLVLQNQLNDLNMQVIVADSYATAEAMAQDLSVDLVLVGISGLALKDTRILQQIKDLFQRLKHPVLMLLGSSSQQSCQQFDDYQPLTCISKPVKQGALEDSMAVLLDLRQPEPVVHQQITLSSQWLSNFKLLVVDDNDVNLNLMKFLLHNYGAHITTACNGQEAVNMARDNLPDLIIMDIHMPILNGFEALKAIRLDQGKQHIPVVALTADAMQQNKNKIIKFGFDGYLIKPINEALLKATLVHLLSIKEHTDKDHPLPYASESAADKFGETLPVRDAAKAIRIAGNSEAIADKLFAQLLDSLPPSQQRISELHASQKWNDLWQEVHKLKGAVSVCGTPALTQVIQRLEAATKSEAEDDITVELGQLEYEIKRLIDSTALNHGTHG